jgi:hypothetical protein
VLSSNWIYFDISGFEAESELNKLLTTRPSL